MNMRKLISLCLTATMIFAAFLPVLSAGPAFAEGEPEEEVHYLAFCSDRHGQIQQGVRIKEAYGQQEERKDHDKEGN